MDSIRLCTVYLVCLKEWLCNVEGPEQSEVSREECLLWMSVSFDPKRYYPFQGVDAVVGMELVFKPAYIHTISLSSLLMTLTDWTNDPEERLSESCMTFLIVFPKSKVFPLCRDYHVLLDLSSKKLVSNHFSRGHLTNFQAFQLPLVRMFNSESQKWICYISVHCIMGSASYLLDPHSEGEFPEKGF